MESPSLTSPSTTGLYPPTPKSNLMWRADAVWWTRQVHIMVGGEWDDPEERFIDLTG